MSGCGHETSEELKELLWKIYYEYCDLVDPTTEKWADWTVNDPLEGWKTYHTWQGSFLATTSEQDLRKIQKAIEKAVDFTDKKSKLAGKKESIGKVYYRFCWNGMGTAVPVGDKKTVGAGTLTPWKLPWERP